MLPKRGTSADALVADLTSESWSDIVSRLHRIELPLSLPKFRVEYGAMISDVLRAMGMEPAFQPGRADLSGIGGAHMAEAGVETPFLLGDLAIMGFAAIPARLPLILRRIREAADAVIAARPDVLVIIDSPEFTHRVAKRVRARAPQIPIVDYVCPSVWAWRAGRARKMRAYVDRVLALLPF